MRCHSPRCRIVFEVRDRVPVCASLDLSSSENGSFFRAKHLAAIKLDDLRDDVYAAAYLRRRAIGWRGARWIG